MNQELHYQAPGWGTRHIANPLMAGLTRLGLSVRGSRILETTGRVSGLARHTPVNLLRLDGTDYLVAPRGETEWVRNVRASGGEIVLQLGRRRESRTAREVPVEGRVEILREYLRRWKAETGVFFGGVGPEASDEELAGIADRHPVFRLD
jgi:deazaflavin-dependent oxidoreductase (nitroreductase family)